MRRREFIAGLGGAAAWPLSAYGQQSERVRRVGVLAAYAEADPEGQARFQVSFRALVDLGWIEGRNLRFDPRWAGPDVGQQSRYARELVALSPDVILVNATSATQALRDATQTIPIVFVNILNPEGCEARGPTGVAADQVRVSHQSQDRQGARSHVPGNAVGHRRRGYSVRRRKFIAGVESARSETLPTDPRHFTVID
jgi:ABC transporter substrate binding protein